MRAERQDSKMQDSVWWLSLSSSPVAELVEANR